MAEVYREVEHTTPTTETEPVNPRAEHSMTVLERLVYLIGGIIIALLAIRFLLSLLGANRSAGFADFIYTASHPFVAPFFGLFNYPDQFEGHRFEWSTLVAILVYAIIMAILARLVTLGSHRRDV
jgi:hypothetical protein